MFSRARQGITNIEYVMIAAVVGMAVVVASQEIGSGMEKITTPVALLFLAENGGQQ